MKNIFNFIKIFEYSVLGFILFVLLLSFSKMGQSNNAAAVVESKDGYLIFFCSKPVTEYESLGEIKIKLTWSGYPAELFNQVLKKVKKDFPKADAIIFDGVEMEKATAIKFK